MKGIVASLFLVAILLALPQAYAQTFSKTETIEYYDNAALWVRGQVKRTTTNGIETSTTTYDTATALPIQSTRFGKPQQTLTYDTTSAVSTGQRGTLKTVSDGRDGVVLETTITLSNWKRGIPQLIQFPATPDQPSGTSKSAEVNDLGLITSVTDENGYKACYGFDAMGRLANITYPSDTVLGVCDTSKWNPVALAFQPIGTDEHGLPAGHWRASRYEGNKHINVYYDALWRPVLEEQLDNSNIGGTLSQVVKRYDASGHLSFQSYPQRGVGNYGDVTQGVRTFYDALDRATRVEQDSELGVLATTTAYLTGFQTSTTNPKGHTTTITRYRAYDQPSTDWPEAITHPEGAYTEIVRDNFDKPTSVKRRNVDGSVASTRSYVYDTAQQLCKTIEPETGATVMDYDAAGNVSWSAAGLTLPDPVDCNRTQATDSGRRAMRTYDARNRLTTLSFPDTLGNQLWSYTPDSLPAQIITYNDINQTLPAINAYHYNSRRLLDGQGESIQQQGWYTWGLGYAYNANGHLAGHSYPTGLYIDYAPNALGQATKAGTYATDVSYHPNGAIAQFTYGNGIVHTLTQNARQLPDRSKDAFGATAVLDDSYAFDGNANVAAISDGLPGQRGNRSMSYDGLDRLTTATSPMFGATPASYSYDVLDNLTRVTAPGRDHFYCYDTKWQLTNIKTGGCSGASVIGLGYDVQGNLDNKNGQNYDFDYGNRLRTATNLESYRYDGLGRRIESIKADGRLHLWQYSQAGQLMFGWTGPTNEATQEYVYLGGSLVAEIDHAWPSNAITATKYQHTDALGSPVAVTDANRNVVERSEYEPYGALLNRPITDGPGYTGHVMDAATGLTYMQQRYYDPSIGRFLSVDPVTAISNGDSRYFNRYWYAAGNPYKFTDPDGRKIVYDGTKEEKKETKKLVSEIKRSGPEGKALVKGLEKGPDIHVSQGTSVTKKDGTVVSLSNTGGGVTVPATESVSGKIEVVFDKSNLVSYTATDGSTAKETPVGLVLHELGHGSLLMKGDPSHVSPGPAAEKAVRDLTNPIREDLGQKPEQ